MSRDGITRQIGSYAHRGVIEMVVDDQMDVGVTPSKGFIQNKNRDSGLTELKRFHITPDLYVTRAGADPMIASALRKSLLAINDVEMLEGIKLAVSAGFAPVNQEDLEEFRGWMAHELEFFETCLPFDQDPSLASPPSMRP